MFPLLCLLALIIAVIAWWSIPEKRHHLRGEGLKTLCGRDIDPMDLYLESPRPICHRCLEISNQQQFLADVIEANDTRLIDALLEKVD